MTKEQIENLTWKTVIVSKNTYDVFIFIRKETKNNSELYVFENESYNRVAFTRNALLELFDVVM